MASKTRKTLKAHHFEGFSYEFIDLFFYLTNIFSTLLPTLTM